MKLTPADCLNAGFCAPGQIRFCRAHGLDLHRFVREGLDFAELVGIEDDNLDRAMAQARARQTEA